MLHAWLQAPAQPRLAPSTALLSRCLSWRLPCVRSPTLTLPCHAWSKMKALLQPQAKRWKLCSSGVAVSHVPRLLRLPIPWSLRAPRPDICAAKTLTTDAFPWQSPAPRSYAESLSVLVQRDCYLQLDHLPRQQGASGYMVNRRIVPL